MPFNFGAFAGGLAGGLERGQKMQLEAEAHKLKAKMLETQQKAAEFDQQEKIRKSQEQQAQQQQLGQVAEDYLASATGGKPAVPGYESPEQQMSVNRVPAQRGATQLTPQQALTAAAIRSGKFPSGAFSQAAGPRQHVVGGNLVDEQGRVIFSAPEKPVNERPVSVAPGGTLVNPRTGETMFSAPNKPDKPERPITVAPGGTVLDPTTGKPIFTAPERPPKPTADIPKSANFKDAKTQLEAMAGKYKSKDIGKIKTDLEGSANQLGYTIQGVRPGIFGWNIDIAPVAPSKRGGGNDIDARLNNMFGK